VIRLENFEIQVLGRGEAWIDIKQDNHEGASDENAPKQTFPKLVLYLVGPSQGRVVRFQ